VYLEFATALRNSALVGDMRAYCQYMRPPRSRARPAGGRRPLGDPRLPDDVARRARGPDDRAQPGLVRGRGAATRGPTPPRSQS
jgi:hypothetical protein